MFVEIKLSNKETHKMKIRLSTKDSTHIMTLHLSSYIQSVLWTVVHYRSHPNSVTSFMDDPLSNLRRDVCRGDNVPSVNWGFLDQLQKHGPSVLKMFVKNVLKNCSTTNINFYGKSIEESTWKESINRGYVITAPISATAKLGCTKNCSMRDFCVCVFTVYRLFIFAFSLCPYLKSFFFITRL